MPWWAAVVVAVTGCAVGFAFDAGSGKDLTIVFSGLYVLGCVAAVLAVRQAGIFTAVVQPPLILFCAVPGAYFVFHGAKFTGVKDLVINCGYPLIERFPLMLLTSAGVLLVGLLRWYLGRFGASATEAAEAADAVDTDGGALGLVARLAALFNRGSADEEKPDKATRPRSRREHAVERTARSSTAAERRSARGTATSSRTRRPRPPIDDAASRPATGRGDAARPASSTIPSRPAAPAVDSPAIPTCVAARRGKSAAIRMPVAPARLVAAAGSTRTNRSSPSTLRLPRRDAGRRPTAPPRPITRSHRSGIAKPPAAKSRSTGHRGDHANLPPTPGSSTPRAAA